MNNSGYYKLPASIRENLNTLAGWYLLDRMADAASVNEYQEKYPAAVIAWHLRAQIAADGPLAPSAVSLLTRLLGGETPASITSEYNARMRRYTAALESHTVQSTPQLRDAVRDAIAKTLAYPARQFIPISIQRDWDIITTDTPIEDFAEFIPASTLEYAYRDYLVETDPVDDIADYILNRVFDDCLDELNTEIRRASQDHAKQLANA